MRPARLSARHNFYGWLGNRALVVAGFSQLPRCWRDLAARRAAAAPADRKPLRAGLSKQRLLALATDPKRRALLKARPHGDDLKATVSLIDAEDLVPLGREVLGSEARDPLEQSNVLYQALILDRATTSRPAMRACLLAVADCASRLQQSHQKSLLKRCLAIAGQPVDPYQPYSIVLAAREAAVDILIADSSLDEVVLSDIRADPAGSIALREVLGATLRSREEDRPAALAATLEAWRPKAPEAERFGELCDTGFSSRDPILAAQSGPHVSRPGLWLSRVLRHGLPVVIGPMLALAVFLITHFDLTGKIFTGLLITPGLALGALALLVATHVVSAQLSAERLPGSLARFSSQPPSVVAGYSAGFSMVAASLVNLRGTDNDLWLQIATFELVVFAASLVAALIALVRRTDTTTAAVGFAADQRLRFASSGRRMGAIQIASIDAQAELESLPWARFGGSDPLSERREPILAASNGFAAIRFERLRALALERKWRDRDLVLHISGSLGTLVHREFELGSVIPGPAVNLSKAEWRRARRVFEVRSEAAIEETAEALSTLTRLAAELQRQGNPGGATRVSDALIDLLGTHLHACHLARGEHDRFAGERLYAVNLALQAVLTSAGPAIAEAQTDAERRVLRAIVGRAIALSAVGDAAATIALGHLPNAGSRKLFGEELEMFWDAASHAIAFEQSTQLEFTLQRLEKWMAIQQGDEIPNPLEIAARLTMLNVWVNQHTAAARWEWFWEKTHPQAKEEGRRLSVVRIGAAALLSGCNSVAIKVALAIGGENLVALKSHIEKQNVSQWEGFLSQQYGYLLGENPAGAMATFLDFAGRVHGSVQ
jgi:hypothetical protein